MHIMVSSSHFYVYLHCYLDGTVFYVGKGCLKRSHSSSQRNQGWRNAIKSGYKISLIAENLSENLAYKIEKNLIAYFFQFGNLVNIQCGGGPIGASNLMKGRIISLKHRENLTKSNQSYDRSKYEKSSQTLSIGLWKTPCGLYHSLRLAADANDCAVMTVRNRCLGFVAKRGIKTYPVSPKKGWEFIQKSDKV